MPTYLTNKNVRDLLPMERVIETIEKLFVSEKNGNVENFPRQSLNIPQGFHRVMLGADYEMGYYGLKTYGTVVGRPKYRVMVYSLEDGRLMGLVDARNLSMLRTAAVCAVGVKYMARPDASTMGIIGTGFEARGQIEAITKVRNLTQIKAFSRNRENREQFASEMTEQYGVDVIPVESAQAAVEDTDILSTVTKADDPIMSAEWLKPGAHICAVGATNLIRREIDVDTVAASDLIVVENLTQAKEECGELVTAAQQGKLDWSAVVELKDIVSETVSGRPSENAITQINTLGVAAEDVVVAATALNEAEASGAGTPLPID